MEDLNGLIATEHCPDGSRSGFEDSFEEVLVVWELGEAASDFLVGFWSFRLTGVLYAVHEASPAFKCVLASLICTYFSTTIIEDLGHGASPATS